MVERIEDLNLPNMVVSRLMKDSIPEGTQISKEARSALCRAASVFVLYLTTTATGNVSKTKQKTLMPAHVFDALEEIEFENFIEPLKAFLEVHQAKEKEKKEIKKKSLSNANAKEDEGANTKDDSDVELVPDD